MEKVLFKNVGRGQFKLRSRLIIQPGQTFFAYPHEVHTAFRDTIKPVEVVKPKEEKKPVLKKERIFYIQRRRKTKWYDVVNHKFKVINKKAMDKKQAEEFIKNLQDAKISR